MTIAATVKQKRRRINVFGDSKSVDPLIEATTGESINGAASNSCDTAMMPTKEDLEKMDPCLRSQINHYYQIFVGQVGNLISSNQNS